MTWVRWWRDESLNRAEQWSKWQALVPEAGIPDAPLAFSAEYAGTVMCMPRDHQVPAHAEHHDGAPSADQCCKPCLSRAEQWRAS
jgi:hypothetical protein